MRGFATVRVPARHRSRSGEAGGLVLWNAGPPWCDLFGIRCCHLSISGTIYFASEYDKSGLGQGIMVFEEGKAQILLIVFLLSLK